MKAGSLKAEGIRLRSRSCQASYGAMARRSGKAAEAARRHKVRSGFEATCSGQAKYYRFRLMDDITEAVLARQEVARLRVGSHGLTERRRL